MNKVKEFFDERAQYWDSYTNKSLDDLAFLLKDIDIKKGDKVLDLACGTGIITEALYQKSQTDLYAVDLSPEMIEVAKSKIKNPKIHFIAEDFLNYQEKNFDVVVLFDAYPHFLDEKAFKTHLFSILKLGGKAYIMHDCPREELNHHHMTFASNVSRLLKPVKDEANDYRPEFEILNAYEDDKTYQVYLKKVTSKISESVYNGGMNKKIEKTISSINAGLTKCLKVKPYDEITIQDILDASNVSRSTFYSHFKTKNELLISICTQIFNHVFSHTLQGERTHDFSKASIFDYKHLITHIFYHVHDERELIDAIFSSESKNIFLNKMKDELKEFASVCINSDLVSKKDIPHDLMERQFINSFIITLEHWQKDNYQETPEVLTEYFIKLN